MSFDDGRFLVGKGTVAQDTVSVARLEADRALVRFNSRPFQASDYRFFSHATRSPSKLHEIRLFWRTDADGGAVQSKVLYPRGSSSLTRLTESDGWTGTIKELGVVVTSATGTSLALDTPILLSHARLEPDGLWRTVLWLLDNWTRNWGFDTRTINTAVPDNLLRPEYSGFAVILAAGVISLLILGVSRPRRWAVDGVVVGFCALLAISTLWLAAYYGHAVATTRTGAALAYDKPLLNLLDRARRAMPTCSGAVRVVTVSENIYFKRRASYLLRPCNAVPARLLSSELSSGTYILVIKPSDVTLSSRDSRLQGINHRHAVEQIFVSPDGALFRIRNARE